MPIYEFKCIECGEKTSELRRIGDFTPPVCSNCGSTRTEKQLSMFGGSGAGGSGCATCTPSHPGA